MYALLFLISYAKNCVVHHFLVLSSCMFSLWLHSARSLLLHDLFFSGSQLKVFSVVFLLFYPHCIYVVLLELRTNFRSEFCLSFCVGGTLIQLVLYNFWSDFSGWNFVMFLLSVDYIYNCFCLLMVLTLKYNWACVEFWYVLKFSVSWFICVSSPIFSSC